MLDPSLRDGDGVPAPKIIYKNSENTQKLIAFHLERQKEAMDASGAKEISLTTLMRDCGWHLMGTCRMGSDPRRSVVDPWCRSHDVENLYILDGSVFVTSSGFNPTATICAVALRAVAHMLETRGAMEAA